MKHIITIYPRTYISIECKLCKTTHRLAVRTVEYENYVSGVFVQDAFPNMNADNRELMISEVCGKCFDNLME